MAINTREKMKVGIIGTGKVGTDLLVKVLRSPHLECTVFAGRNRASEGISFAKQLGVCSSTQSMQGILNHGSDIDLVFDATSAKDHEIHAPILDRLGFIAIDLTPANIGDACIPALNIDVSRNKKNINMVTCGGQASVPIVELLPKFLDNIESIEVKSVLAEDSIGPATLANIDNYYCVTKKMLSKYGGSDKVDVALLSDDSSTPKNMLTSIVVKTDQAPSASLAKALERRADEVRGYVPGYNVVGLPRYESGYLSIDVEVVGQGDYLPAYAGNLDIINCAAIATAECIAVRRAKRHFPTVFSSVAQLWSKAS
ncbi:MAG: acetylating acetaldehyde dehydrogenase [Agarilytica sp.]